MTSETPRVLDYGSNVTAFADVLAIEQHGPMAHLIFAVTQREYVGSDNKVAKVECRIIVPAAILARLARQLARPHMIDGAESDGLEASVH